MPTAKFWREVHAAAFGNPYEMPKEPTMCVMSARYGGIYEGGLFVCLPAEDWQSAAFGEDLACAEWWDENQDRTGVGSTPDAALLNWFEKYQARMGEKNAE